MIYVLKQIKKLLSLKQITMGVLLFTIHNAQLKVLQYSDHRTVVKEASR